MQKDCYNILALFQSTRLLVKSRSHVVRSKQVDGLYILAYLISLVRYVAGFPLLFMYFSRYLVPVFKSRDLFECACNGDRRQTL